jgi:ribosome-associated translation inhibitor RaiA
MKLGEKRLVNKSRSGGRSPPLTFFLEEIMENTILKTPDDLDENLKNHIDRTIARIKRYFGKSPIVISFKTIARNKKNVQIKIQKGRQNYFAVGNGKNYFVALNKARILIKKKINEEKYIRGRRNEKSKNKNKRQEHLFSDKEDILFNTNDYYEGSIGECDDVG